MSLLSIDQKKCKQDGFCATDCPMGIIRFEGKGSYPEISPESESMCLSCGHCVAVCPHGALDHAEVPLAACKAIDRALVISTGQAEQFLRSRRSVRRFKDQPVEQATLRRLIEIARYAPTARNSQLVEWLVIDDSQRLHDIAGQVIDWMRSLLKDPKSLVMPFYPLLVNAWEAGIDSVLHSAPCLVAAMAPGPAPNRIVDLTLALSYSGVGRAPIWTGDLLGRSAARRDARQPCPEASGGHSPRLPFSLPDDDRLRQSALLPAARAPGAKDSLAITITDHPTISSVDPQSNRRRKL